MTMNNDSTMTTTKKTTTTTTTETIKPAPVKDPETLAKLRAAALEYGKIQHTYRIPHGFMGYGSSGAWS
jgi:hypothetical protein